MNEYRRITEETAENIFRIPVCLPGNPLKELNSYFIRDPERSILIDTGFRLPECREALLAGLAELGEDPGCVDIFLTHLHADHSGLATELAGESRRVYISEIEGRMLMNLPVRDGESAKESAGEGAGEGAGESAGEGSGLRDGGNGEGRNGERSNQRGERDDFSRIRRRMDMLAGMPPDIVDDLVTINPAIIFAPPRGYKYSMVADGEVLRAGGYELRCILTPGHSPGHMCLWDESRGLMFAGDHVLFDITPNITAWPSVEDSLGDYLDSLRKVRELPVITALPGHRKPGNFHQRIDELLKHHETRLAEVESIISSTPGLSAYDIAGRMRWKIRANSWDEFPAAQKIFAVGECQSHLDYLRLRGVIYREETDGVYKFRSA